MRTITNADLLKIVQTYLDKLEWNRPLVNSDRFYENSYSKWGCKELIRFIKESEDLPFTITPQEILEQFIAKMKEYAAVNSKNSLGFVIAAETGEYFLEESWHLVQK